MLPPSRLWLLFRPPNSPPSIVLVRIFVLLPLLLHLCHGTNLSTPNAALRTSRPHFSQRYPIQLLPCSLSSHDTASPSCNTLHLGPDPALMPLLHAAATNRLSNTPSSFAPKWQIWWNNGTGLSFHTVKQCYYPTFACHLLAWSPNVTVVLESSSTLFFRMSTSTLLLLWLRRTRVW